MSTSELRRGPGWWMDLDGSWKPPQDWPEATPPLPGWTRDSQGTWGPTMIGKEVEAEIFAATTITADPVRPIPDVANITHSTEVPSLSTLGDPIATTTIHAAPASTTLRAAPLTYSEAKFEAPPEADVQRAFRRALMAAFVAAVTCSMLAAGLIVLLMVL
jgi:hypothetical protein